MLRTGELVILAAGNKGTIGASTMETSNTPPVSTGLVKPKANPLIHSPPLLLRRPSQTHFTYSAHPTYRLIPSTSVAG